MSNQTTKKDADNRSDEGVLKQLRTIWLGMQDSNLRCQDQNLVPYHLANPQYLTFLL